MIEWSVSVIDGVRRLLEWVQSAIVCRSHDSPFPFGVLTAWRQVSQKSLYGRRLLCPCAQPARLGLGVGSPRSVRSSRSRNLGAFVSGFAVGQMAELAAVRTARLAAVHTVGLAALHATGLAG